jgi:hypothetical protein
MKKLLFLLLFTPFILQAQKNTISLAIQPNRYMWDSGIGLSYDRSFHNLSAFIAYTQGKHSFGDLSSLKQRKISIGITYIAYKETDYKFLFAGSLNGSLMSGHIPIEIPKMIYRHLSFSFGVGAIMGHNKIVTLYDPLRKESLLLIGLIF